MALLLRTKPIAAKSPNAKLLALFMCKTSLVPDKIKGMSAYGTVWRVLGLRGADIFKATTCAAKSALRVLSILRKSLSFANFEFAERNLRRFAIGNLFDHALQQVSVHFKQGNMQILHQQDQVVQPVEDLAQGSNQLLVRDNTAFESRSKERSSKMRERESPVAHPWPN